MSGDEIRREAAGSGRYPGGSAAGRPHLGGGERFPSRDRQEVARLHAAELVPPLSSQPPRSIAGFGTAPIRLRLPASASHLPSPITRETTTWTRPSLARSTQGWSRPATTWSTISTTSARISRVRCGGAAGGVCSGFPAPPDHRSGPESSPNPVVVAVLPDPLRRHEGRGPAGVAGGRGPEQLLPRLTRGDEPPAKLSARRAYRRRSGQISGDELELLTQSTLTPCPVPHPGREAQASSPNAAN